MNPSEKAQRIHTFCLLILTAIATAGALYFFSSVMIPFVLAIFFTFCLTPIIDVQVKWLHFPRLMAIVSTIILGCVLLFMVGLLISAAVSEITNRTGDYQVQIEQMFQQVVSVLRLERFGIDAEELPKSIFKIPRETAKSIFANTISGIMNILSNGMLVLIFMIFLLSGQRLSKAPAHGIRYEIEARTKRYILTMVFTSSITGLLIGIVLALLGVDFAWMFGFLAFLLNFIPNIGSIIATVLPLPVVFLSPELSMAAKISALAIPAIIQFLIGNLVQPKIMGQSLDLHPVTVLMSLIFFGTIWGIVGMFLATPITAILKILLERFEYTRPVANLLAGRIDTLSEEATKTGEHITRPVE
ncbi:MAG: AI-2E family transporter [Planctomycetota bacterium]|nr:MAG: AI-2E family transporter [Planctomycetota bacterium]